jgi:ABC-type microcin C transport system permease subunit YejB
MQEKISPPVLPFQDEPAAQHRRQMLWQVWVPLIATLIIVLALVILAIIGTVQGSSQVNRWGNISAVLVILPVMLCGVTFLVLFGGGAYGMSKLLKKMPGWMLRAQLFMLHLSLTVRRVSDTATKPVFKVNTLSTRVSTLWDRIFHRKRTGMHT